MSPAYQVLPYTIAQFLDLCARYSKATKDVIEEKLHKAYFEGYFSGINARTIVVEEEYVDRDYLEDFISYYVKCFCPYERYCVTYPPEGRRYFPVTKKYDVSLFGLNLSIDTLAYQEQDHVAAACATSALWSIFQKTGNLFHHPIPTPVEITNAATLNLPNQRRSLPNDGLTIEEMAHAIRKVGLEPYPVNVKNSIYDMKSTIYAYLKSGLPLPMGIALVDASGSTHQIVGLHAIAVTGFSLGGSIQPLAGTGFQSNSSKIDKIYVHDDQIGPFARMEFDGVQVKVNLGYGVRDHYSLKTSWRDSSGGGARACPREILLPLYHKIRIPLAVIEDVVMGFDSVVELFRGRGTVPLADRLSWDIYLSNLNDFKKDILHSPHIENGHREEILTKSLPRFLWRARASSGNMPIIELVFDATDIEQGNFYQIPIKYATAFYEILRSIPLATVKSSNPSKAIFEAISKS